MKCKNCGRKLKEGEICKCQKESVKNLAAMIKGMFVKPIDTLKKHTSDGNFVISIILVAFMSITAGMLVLAFANDIYSNFISPVLFYSVFFYDASYLKILFMTLISVFVLSFAFAGILYLVNTIMFGGNASYQKVYSLCGLVSIVMSVTLLIATVFAYINIAFAMVIFFLGAFLSSIYMYHGLKVIGPKDENKYGYIALITAMLFYIVLTVFLCFIYF